MLMANIPLILKVSIDRSDNKLFLEVLVDSNVAMRAFHGGKNITTREIPWWTAATLG